jgi:hypothetical protein
MKKILLIIFTIILILSVNVLAVSIDIGPEAIDRGGFIGANYTRIMMDNPANADGKITSVELWAYSDLSGCIVATFFVVSGNTLSARDHQTVDNGNGAGVVIAGSKQTFTVDLDVQTGDYIGLFYSVGNMERDASGFAGLWGKSGDYTASSDITYGTAAGDTESIKGIGATVGWDHKWNTQTISKWNTKEFTKWNGLE